MEEYIEIQLLQSNCARYRLSIRSTSVIRSHLSRIHGTTVTQKNIKCGAGATVIFSWSQQVEILGWTAYTLVSNKIRTASVNIGWCTPNTKCAFQIENELYPTKKRLTWIRILSNTRPCCLSFYHLLIWRWPGQGCQIDAVCYSQLCQKSVSRGSQQIKLKKKTMTKFPLSWWRPCENSSHNFNERVAWWWFF